MIKLYKYELYRIMFNKLFLGLLVIAIVYSYLVMDSEIVLGVANTAPFSSWSYGAFVSDILPLLLISLLFLISFIYSSNERKVQVITQTMPIDHSKYYLVRCTVIVTGFIVIMLTTIAVSLIFYARVFHYTDFVGFIAPTLLVLVPSVLFILGLGITLGRLQPVLVYVLIPVIFLLMILPIPNAWDMLCSRFFSTYPTMLNKVEPSFSIPISMLYGKISYAIVGIGLTLFGMTDISIFKKNT